MNYRICSIKTTVIFNGELSDAIRQALLIDSEFRPAFGVQVYIAEGEGEGSHDDDDMLWDTEDPEYYRDVLEDDERYDTSPHSELGRVIDTA